MLRFFGPFGQVVEIVHGLNGRKGVDVQVFELLEDLIRGVAREADLEAVGLRSRFGLHGGCPQDAAGPLLFLDDLLEDFAGPFHHRVRHAGELGDFNAVAAVRRAGDDAS